MQTLDLTILWLLGLGIVFDFLVTWFWSEFPAHAFRMLWKMGWRRNQPGFWPESVEQYDTWGREQWTVWAVLKLGAFGELLTCPVCLSRHVAWITALCMLPFTGLQAWPAMLAGALTWPGAANRLLK